MKQCIQTHQISGGKTSLGGNIIGFFFLSVLFIGPLSWKQNIFEDGNHWNPLLVGVRVQWCSWRWSPFLSASGKFVLEQKNAGKHTNNQMGGWGGGGKLWHRGASWQLVWLQKPEGVKTFMSRGLSLCGRCETCLGSETEISILGGRNLAGSSTLRLIWVFVPSIVEDFCRPK